jgi:biotin carboxyl carrier protein
VQKATINEKHFEIVSTEEGFLVNNSLVQWDLAKISKGYFHILYNNKGYRAEVVKQDAAAKTVVIKINGHSYAVALKDQFDLLLEKMGMSAVATSKINNIKAPMPGLIIDLKVKIGDSVKTGDQLLILEAMKMENILKAQGEGVIKNVKVKKGDSVEKGQVLIEFF